MGMCIRTQMDKAYNFITNHSFSEILQNTTVHIRHNNVITEILKNGTGGGFRDTAFSNTTANSIKCEDE